MMNLIQSRYHAEANQMYRLFAHTTENDMDLKHELDTTIDPFCHTEKDSVTPVEQTRVSHRMREEVVLK